MFGKKDERAARSAAARESADRLLSLPVADLAAEIMPAFGPDGVSTKYGQRIGALQVANWLLKQYPRGTGQLKELLNPVREALQALEHAELILRRPLGGGDFEWQVTRLGESALADGSVSQYLARPAAG